VVADGVSLVRIGQAAEDVPWSGDGQEDERAGEEVQFAPAAPLAGEDEVRQSRADEKDRGDEALGEQGQGYAGIGPVEAVVLAALQGGDEGVEGDEQEQAQVGLGNDEAGVEECSDGGEHGQAGVESGAGAPGAAGPVPGEPAEAEHGERVGQVGGEGVLAEELVADGDGPVGQWGLLDVADAVDLAGDPVAAVDNVLGGLGVRSVNVVEQGRRKERAHLDGKKDENKEQPGGHGGWALRWTRDGRVRMV